MIGKVNEVVKSFVVFNNDYGYKEAKKLLVERFGDFYYVVEGYKF